MGKRGLPKKSCKLCRTRKVKCDREASSTGTCTFCAERKVICILEEEDRNRISHNSTNADQQQQHHQQSSAAATASTSYIPSSTNDPLHEPPYTLTTSPSESNETSQCSCPDLFHRYDCPISLLNTATHQSVWDTSEYFASVLAGPLPIPFFDQQSISPQGSSNSPTGAALIPSTPTSSFQQRRVLFRGGLFDVDGLTRSILDQSANAFFTFVNPYLPILEPSHFWPRYRSYFAQYSTTHNKDDEGVDQPLSILLILATAIKGIGHTTLPNKFDMQKKMLDRFMSQCTDSNSLAEDGLDALEALLLFHAEDTPSPDLKKPLAMHPLETEVLIKLGKVCKVNETCQDKEIATRRAVISTMTIVYDALSMRKGQLYLIKDEDIDAEIASIEYLNEDKAQWLKVLRSLALLARGNARQLFSSKVKKQGVIAQDVETLVDRIQTLYRSFPVQYKWPSLQDSDFHSQPVSLPQAIFSSLITEQLAIIQGCVEECGWDLSRARSSDYQRAEQSLNTALKNAYMETVDVAYRGAKCGLYNLCVPVLRNAAAGCAKYAMTASLSDDAPVRQPQASLFGMPSIDNLPLSHPLHTFPQGALQIHVRLLLDAIQTATNFPDTGTLSSALEEEYQLWKGSHTLEGS